MTITSLATAWNTQSPHRTALEACQRFHWSVFPIDKDKKPLQTDGIHSNGTPKRMGWKAFQTRKPSVQEIQNWHDTYAPAAWAVITGGISNVIILDFDGAAGQETCQRLDLQPHLITGSGGAHVYFAHPGWPVQTLNSKSQKELGRRWPGLDIRADGGYAAFCGRNTNGAYVWLRDPRPEELTILPEDLRSFLGILRAPKPRIPTVKSESSAPEQSGNKPTLAIANTLVRRALTMIRKEGAGRNDAGFWLACQLRDNNYPQQTAQKIMQSYIEQVPAENTKGKIEPYTIEEALASLTSAYREQAREAWAVQSPLAGSSVGNGKGRTEVTTAQGNSEELPEIILGGDQLRDLTNQAIDAVSRFENLAPSLFMQSSRLVRIGHDEVKRPVVTQMGIAEVKEVLTHSANYFRLRKIPNSDGEYAKVPCSPAKEIAEQILARQTQRPYLPFPALHAIVETPVIRPDGSILDQPGYDAATRLYYAPHPQLGQCKVPAHPTQEERQTALALIMDTIGEFPYVSEADRANALGLLLTPILRPAIKRHVPLGLLDAPKPGTGKGLFADVVSIIATGGSASILTATDNEEEWDKRITAMLIQGRTIICIDNIAGRLQSAKLDAVLTADIHEGRVLGQSTMVKVHNRATWLATGNNIRLGGDLGRRCYRIRFDPHVSRPWLRHGFKHEDLATWVQEHRGILIEALLTLARAWYADGQPEAAGLPSVGGTFTGWAKTIGSILAYAGVTGFLSNLEQLYEEADEDSAQWEAFLQTWLERFGSEWITVAELVETITDKENAAGSCFADILPDALQYALKEKPASFKIRVGKALDKRVDTCYGRENLHLEKTFDKHNKKSLWRVFAGSAGSSSHPTRSENPQSLQGKENIYNSDQNYFPHSPQATTGETASSDCTSTANTLFSSQGNEQIAGCDEQLPANNDDREVFEI